jgi:Replication initiator protein A
MDSASNTTTPPSPKPLALLGRDEMNLAEFPITLLTDRVPKDQKEAVYQDEIYDDRTGLTLTRKLTIQAGNYGLTTAVDDELILALIQLTKLKNGFTNRRVQFTRHDLLQLLGWNGGGASYERMLLSLRKWTSVFLQYENAWRDNRTKT